MLYRAVELWKTVKTFVKLVFVFASFVDPRYASCATVRPISHARPVLQRARAAT